jgi:surface carbohydrate biosynthesis protein
MIKQLINNIIEDIFKNGYTRRLVIKKPEQIEIVIFDKQLLWLLEKVFLENMNYGVICTRGEEININPLFLLRFLFTYLTNNISISEAYYLDLARCYSPKVILTHIDNDLNFAFLSEFYKNPKYYAIQNGFRCKEQLKRLKNMPTFFCYGQREVDLYKKCGISVEKYVPIGSSKFSYYRENIVDISTEKKYDLCLVSQYRNGKINLDDPIWSTIRRMFEYLNRFISDTGYSLSIALTPKGQDDKEEREYFLSLFEERADLVGNDKKFTSYVACDDAHVVVSFHSTLAFEFFGAGKKTLFCAGLGGSELLKEYNFDNPSSDLMIVNEQSYNEFSKKLQTLINMNVDQYMNDTVRDRNYVMENAHIGSHNLIREMITDELL